MKKRIEAALNTMEPMNCIAYYRVSTGKQKQSGLGLEAQKEMVRNYIKAHSGRKLIAEYEEVESGRNSKRPVIQAALARCKKERARLIIAKLDRLARNVHFISGLMESKVQFTALDLPDQDPLHIHIYAAFAEHEARRISQRIREALEQARKRGKKLGGHRHLRDWSAKGEKKVYLRDKQVEKSNGTRRRRLPQAVQPALRTSRSAKPNCWSLHNLCAKAA